jgi:hypothetical protein
VLFFSVSSESTFSSSSMASSSLSPMPLPSLQVKLDARTATQAQVLARAPRLFCSICSYEPSESIEEESTKADAPEVAAAAAAAVEEEALKNIDDVTLLPCQHKFCEGCFQGWMRTKALDKTLPASKRATCPNCRADVTCWIKGSDGSCEVPCLEALRTQDRESCLLADMLRAIDYHCLADNAGRAAIDTAEREARLAHEAAERAKAVAANQRPPSRIVHPEIQWRTLLDQVRANDQLASALDTLAIKPDLATLLPLAARCISVLRTTCRHLGSSGTSPLRRGSPADFLHGMLSIMGPMMAGHGDAFPPISMMFGPPQPSRATSPPPVTSEPAAAAAAAPITPQTESQPSDRLRRRTHTEAAAEEEKETTTMATGTTPSSDAVQPTAAKRARRQR